MALGREHDWYFNKLKRLITEALVVRSFDVQKDVVASADTSSYEVGSVQL